MIIIAWMIVRVARVSQSKVKGNIIVSRAYNRTRVKIDTILFPIRWKRSEPRTFGGG